MHHIKGRTRMELEKLGNIAWLIAVAIIWGVTNAFMKTGVKGIEKVKSKTTTFQIKEELFYLLQNFKYMTPFVINQGGSVLFYFAVSRNDISFAVPLVNSLTLVFTLITGYFLGEKLSKEMVFGIMLVLVGVTICISDKSGRRSKYRTLMHW